MENHSHDGCSCGCGCDCAADDVVFPDDMPDWADLPGSTVLCPCVGVTKDNVIKAISQGADTLPLLKVMTGAGRETKCRDKNPLGRSCELDLLKMIAIYA
jgi:hypothetical protein